jgi:hypothetical protein
MVADEESEEWDRTIKIGQTVYHDWKKRRQLWKHRKYFALLNVGFDNWTPPEIDSQHGRPQKNFERFRKDTIILAGYYHVVVRLDGTTRIEADSIKFSKMDEVTFQDLYSKTIDIFLERIYGGDWTAEQINEAVEKYLSFA